MVKETWPNYRVINRMRLDGITFADIAHTLEDTEYHIADFWNRFHEKKRLQKKQWDAEHRGQDKEKRRAYREAHKDEINARARQDRKDNPEKYKEIYRRRKQRAEERGIKLNDPEYKRRYYEMNRDYLIEQSRQYFLNHYESSTDRIKKYYLKNRDRILEYHVQYYQKNKKTRIERLIEDGVLQSDYQCMPPLSSYALQVKQFLDDNNLIYELEKTFDGCRDKRKLPFDFYLIDYGVLIEVDGEQHFEITNFGGSNISDEDLMLQLLLTQRHDEIKNTYCMSHGIPLIRISYDEIESKDWQIRILNCIQHMAVDSTAI